MKRVQIDEDFNYGDVEVEAYQLVGGTWTLAKGVHRSQNPHF